MKLFGRGIGGSARGSRFGAVAVRLGHATAVQVEMALHEQQTRATSPGEHRRIGALMVEMGMITSNQLSHILGRSMTEEYRISEDAFALATRIAPQISDSRVFLFTTPSRTPLLAELLNQLAIALSLLGDGPALLVDGDLESPTLHARFGVSASPGLGDILLGKGALDTVSRPTAIAGLHLLPAGGTGRCPLPLLLSDRVGELFAQMRKDFKLVLVAAAPIVGSAETGMLAPQADGAVIGAVAGRDSLSSVARSAEMFRMLRVPVLGSVLCE